MKTRSPKIARENIGVGGKKAAKKKTERPVIHKDVLVGTFAYLAPEIITDRNYSEKSDIYALGVCLFIMLTGCFPYSIDEAQASQRKWMWKVNWDKVKHVDSRLRRLLQGMLNMDVR